MGFNPNPDPNIYSWDSNPDPEFVWFENMISLPIGSYAWSVRYRSYCGGEVVADYSEVFIIEVVEKDTLISPPELNVDGCSEVTRKIEAGSPIDLGMVLENDDLFKYPRAVALRAEGSDIDLIKLHCSGCEGGESTQTLPVRDEVTGYSRKLEGKGTLNSPEDLGQIFKIQEQIRELQKKISKLNDSIQSMIHDTTFVLPEKIKRLTNQKESAERNKNALSDSLILLNHTLVQQTDSIIHISADLMTERDSIHSITRRINLSENLIDSISSILHGKPNEAEREQITRVAEARKKLESGKEYLLQKEKEILQTAEELKNNIKTAEETLSNAASHYQSVKTTAENLSRQINELESIRLSNPDYLMVSQRETEWQRKTNQFLVQYVPANKQAEMVIQMGKIIQKCEEAMSKETKEERTEEYDRFENMQKG